MEAIQFSGLNELDDDEKQTLNEVCTRNYDKVKMLLHNENTSISVHIKTYRQKGERKKYSVTLKAMAPTKIFRSGTSGWILANVLHEAFEKIEKEIQNYFKI